MVAVIIAATGAGTVVGCASAAAAIAAARAAAAAAGTPGAVSAAIAAVGSQCLVSWVQCLSIVTSLFITLHSGFVC